VSRTAEAGKDSRRSSFARSATAMYATTIAAAVLSLGNVFVTSRTLGPSGRGEVAFCTTVAILVSQFASLGLHEANANIAGRNPELTGALAGNSLLLSFALGAAGAAAVLVLIACVPAAAGDAPRWLLVLVLASLPMLIFQLSLWYLAVAHYEFVYIRVAWLLPPVMNFCGNGLLASLHALTASRAVGIWLTGQAAGTILFCWMVATRLGGFGRPKLNLAAQATTFGLKTHAGRSLLWADYRADQWILGSVGDAAQLGAYSVAVVWSETLFYLADALETIQRADLVRAEPRAAYRQLAVVFRYAIVATVPVGLGLIVLAPVLCTMLLGPGYHSSVSQLRVLVLGAPGILALKLCGSALRAQGKPIREAAAIAVASIGVIGLDIALIPGGGGMGAAVASTLGYTAGGAAAAAIAVRTLSGRAAELRPTPRDVRAMTGLVGGLVSNGAQRCTLRRRREPLKKGIDDK
jgi:O-antigen/teichoic acid export membrane protein